MIFSGLQLTKTMKNKNWCMQKFMTVPTHTTHDGSNTQGHRTHRAITLQFQKHPRPVHQSRRAVISLVPKSVLPPSQISGKRPFTQSTKRMKGQQQESPEEPEPDTNSSEGEDERQRKESAEEQEPQMNSSEGEDKCQQKEMPEEQEPEFNSSEGEAGDDEFEPQHEQGPKATSEDEQSNQAWATPCTRV